jgi:diguanylate cyclase (GGDEF)-like protein
MSLISLRKAMDAQEHETLASARSSFRSALLAVSDAVFKSCPPIGEGFKAGLSSITKRLEGDLSPAIFRDIENDLRTALDSWSGAAAQYHHDQSSEAKHLLALLGKTAGDVGERDDRYAKRFTEVKGHLQAAARLDDLASMRQSLGKSVTDLQTCVTNMAKDGQDSITQLRSQIAAYESRLVEVEHLASVDQLTGVANRRKVEGELFLRIEKGQPFGVLYLDLNGFKQVNDTLGHTAGDDLLKQFAGELRAAFRATDLVGRWGGDEFIVLIDGNVRDAKASTDRINKWVNGEYLLKAHGDPEKVTVSAAFGFASWKPGQTVTEVLQSADLAMYQDKRRARSS